MGLPDLVDLAVLFHASRYFFASALLSTCNFHNSVTGISRIFSSYSILSPSGKGSPDFSRTEAMGATPVVFGRFESDRRVRQMIGLLMSTPQYQVQ